MVVGAYELCAGFVGLTVFIGIDFRLRRHSKTELFSRNEEVWSC